MGGRDSGAPGPPVPHPTVGLDENGGELPGEAQRAQPSAFLRAQKQAHAVTTEGHVEDDGCFLGAPNASSSGHRAPPCHPPAQRALLRGEGSEGLQDA